MTATKIPGTILPPSGEPFEIVGTAEARTALTFLADLAEGDFGQQSVPGDEEQKAVPYEPFETRLLDVLAHRDHLFSQVTELQAFNTETLLGVRRYKRAVAAVLDMADDIDGSTFTAREVTRAIASALAPDAESPALTAETPASSSAEPPRDEKLWAFLVSDSTGILMLEHAPKLREHIEAQGDVADYLEAPGDGLWFWEGVATWPNGITYYDNDSAELTLTGEWRKATVRQAVTAEAPDAGRAS